MKTTPRDAQLALIAGALDQLAQKASFLAGKYADAPPMSDAMLKFNLEHDTDSLERRCTDTLAALKQAPSNHHDHA